MNDNLRRIGKFFCVICFYAVSAPWAWASTYEFDHVHTQILFFVDHFGFSKSQGAFLEFEGQLTFDKNKFEKSDVSITIFTESIEMDDEKWNKKMMGKKYFNTKAYPTIKFESTRIQRVDERNALVYGNLTLLDTTRPITLDMRFNKSGTNLATGMKTAGFSGRTSLNRSDFGMNTYLKFIGDEIEIRLEVEGVIKPVRKNDF